MRNILPIDSPSGGSIILLVSNFLLFHFFTAMQAKNPFNGDDINLPSTPINFLELAKSAKVLVLPLAFALFGAWLALRITGGLDVYLLTSRMETIGGEIDKNNQACMAAVESNNKLKVEYEDKLDTLGNVLEARMKRTAKTITSSGSVIPASVPQK